MLPCVHDGGAHEVCVYLCYVWGGAPCRCEEHPVTIVNPPPLPAPASPPLLTSFACTLLLLPSRYPPLTAWRCAGCR